VGSGGVRWGLVGSGGVCAGSEGFAGWLGYDWGSVGSGGVGWGLVGSVNGGVDKGSIRGIVHGVAVTCVWCDP